MPNRQFHTLVRRAGAALLAAVWIGPVSPPIVHGEDRPATATQPAARVVPLAPGVRVDWAQRQLEIDAEVVLREGYLELLACSPGTKEHESILRVRAKPLDVFRGLGMLGFPDGVAPRYEQASQTLYPPRGTPVDVRIRWTKDGRTVVDDAREWLRRKESDAPPGDVAWYYIASLPRAGERLPADIYGTVVTLAPFGSALVMLAPPRSIAPPTTQPASATPTTRRAAGNPEQDGQYIDQPGDWVLIPAADRVPPEGTKVTLLIRAAGRELRVRLDRFGRVRLDNREIDLPGLTRAAREVVRVDEAARAVLEVDPGAVSRDEADVMRALERGGIPRARVERRMRGGAAFPENDPDAAADLLLHQVALHRTLWREMSDELGRIAQRLDAQRESLERNIGALEELVERWGGTRATVATQPSP